MPLSDGQVSRWVTSSVSRGVASSEAEVRCAVEGLGGEASSEAEVAPRVRGRTRMGRTAEVGRRPSEDWASLGPGKDFGRCRRVGAIEQSFFPFGSEEDCRSRLAVVVEPGKVAGTVDLIALCVLRAIWSLD